ncbi:MAG TPA: hypothetical protein VJJ21_02120 [Candidatus Nanoarchaeia archaeon]|nr:hypothetical protein [Candidatus Nanoarchaeia archaeon]
MNITTIQVYEDTKKMLDKIKQYPRESYDNVIKRVFQSIPSKQLPTMEEMFKRGDDIHKGKKVSTQKVVELSHALRIKR